MLAEPGAPAALVLTCADGTVCDAMLCDADLSVRFTVTGGALLGVGNGDPSSHEPDCADTRRLFHGCAQAIVRGDAGAVMTVTAVCGNWTAECRVTVPAADAASIPSCAQRIRICPWRMSDVSDVPPTAAQLHDLMYNWIPTMVGVPESLMMRGQRGYASVCGSFDAPKVPAVIHLENIAGRFELYLCGERVLISADEAPHSYKVPVPARLRGLNAELTMVFTCTGGAVQVGEVYVCTGAC